MTVRTYTNAEIVWSDGERTKVPQMRVEFREDTPQSGVRIAPQRFEAQCETIRMEPRLARQILRAFPRVCWKCYDRRTRSHNRRCAWRGRGRTAEAGEV